MKQTRKIGSRLMALGLTLVMALSLTALGAFAAGTTVTGADAKASVTVQGSANDEGATVNLYKLIDMNWTPVGENQVQPQNPVYVWNSAVAQWVRTNHSTYIGTGTDNTVTTAFTKADAKTLSTFYKNIQSQVSTTVAGTGTIAGGTATINNLTMGQYLVVATKEGNTYNSATVTLAPQWSGSAWVLDNATVTLKSKGDIQKEANNTNVNIGDTVTYTVTVAMPVYPDDAVENAKKFNVGDSMSHGLDWIAESLTVYWSTDGTKVDSQKVENGTNTYYTVDTSGSDDSCDKFEVRFNYDTLTENYPSAKYVHVVYQATINEYAFETDALGNTAYVGVNTNPYDNSSYETTTVDEDVYTYGITVNKVDEDGTTPLAGAEFKLYSNAQCTTQVNFSYNEMKNAYLYDAKGSDTLTSGADGKIQIQGLACGTYYLKETKAPNGYALPGDVVTITITDSDKDGNLDVTTATGSMVVQEAGTYAIGGPGDDPLDNIFSFKVKNEKPDFTLPTTGGMGTVAFTVGGVILMACGAALVLFAVKKFKAEG